MPTRAKDAFITTDFLLNSRSAAWIDSSRWSNRPIVVRSFTTMSVEPITSILRRNHYVNATHHRETPFDETLRHG
jgi:hypothetical protein